MSELEANDASESASNEEAKARLEATDWSLYPPPPWNDDARVAEMPRIETERLLLRAPYNTDAAALMRILSSPLIELDAVYVPKLYTEEYAVLWARHERRMVVDEGQYTFLIVRQEDARVIGYVGLGVASRHQNAELGFWLDVDCWGQGYATEAARAAVRFAFDQLALNRVWASTLMMNNRARRVLDKLGMAWEAYLPHHIFRWDMFESVICYGMVRADHERMSAADPPSPYSFSGRLSWEDC